MQISIANTVQEGDTSFDELIKINDSLAHVISARWIVSTQDKLRSTYDFYEQTRDSARTLL